MMLKGGVTVHFTYAAASIKTNDVTVIHIKELLIKKTTLTAIKALFHH